MFSATKKNKHNNIVCSLSQSESKRISGTINISGGNY